MKLVVAVVPETDRNRLMDRLRESGFSGTMIDSSGGWTGPGNATLIIGVQEPALAELMNLISSESRTRRRNIAAGSPMVEPGGFIAARPIEEVTGGASVFVFSVERYERMAARGR